MIGFDINAWGSHDFHWHRGAWTEGSLWLAKAAFMAVPKSPENKASKAEVKLIEQAFNRIKDSMFKDISNLGINMHLNVTGDFNFMYQFQSSKSGFQTAQELLYLIAGQKEDMGDQVMIYFCKCILDFRLNVIMDDVAGVDNLWLRVDIHL